MPAGSAILNIGIGSGEKSLGWMQTVLCFALLCQSSINKKAACADQRHRTRSPRFKPSRQRNEIYSLTASADNHVPASLPSALQPPRPRNRTHTTRCSRRTSALNINLGTKPPALKRPELPAASPKSPCATSSAQQFIKPSGSNAAERPGCVRGTRGSRLAAHLTTAACFEPLSWNNPQGVC